MSPIINDLSSSDSVKLLDTLHLSMTEENDVSSQSSQITSNSEPNSVNSPTTSSDSLPSPTFIPNSQLDILLIPEELQIYIIQFCTPLERFQVICRISKHFYNVIFSHKGWSCVVGSVTSPHIKDISSCIFDCAWFSKKKKLHTLAVGLSSASGGVTASTSVGRKRRAILQARLPSNNNIEQEHQIVNNNSDGTIENLFSKCNFEHIEVNCSTVPSTRLLLSYAKVYCKYLKTLIFGYNYHVDIKDLIENILIPFSNQLENLNFSFQWDSSIIYNGMDTLQSNTPNILDQNVKPQLLFSPKGIPFFATPQQTKRSEEKPKPATINQLPIVECFAPSFELTKLKILDIFIGNSSAIAKQFFIKVCQSSPNLRVCKLKGDIQTEMLLSLSKFCRYLEVLILYNTGKEKLTDDSIGDMLKIGGAFNMSLRVLSLSCPSLTLRSIALITKFCKNLQYFAIRSLNIKKESNNDHMTFHKLEQLKVLKVKDEMNYANWLSDRLLKCLSSDIEYIQVPVPTDESDVAFTLSSEEISFKKLKCLRLTQINSETFPNFFLGGCSNNLKELYLELDNERFNMLNPLKSFVPKLINLTTLTLEMSEFDSTLFTILSHLPNLRRLYIKTRGNIEKYDSENGWKLKRLVNLDTLLINSASISQFFTDDFIISLNNLVMIWLACPVNCKAIIDHEELSEEDKLNISVENVIRCCDQYVHDHFEEISQEVKLEMKKEIKLRLLGDTQYEYSETKHSSSTNSNSEQKLYSNSNVDDNNAYRKVEKIYRKHFVPNKHGKMVEADHPDTTDVIDFHNLEKNTPANLEILEEVQLPSSEMDMKYFEQALEKYNQNFSNDEYLKSTMTFTKEELLSKKIYTFKGYPGFYVIKDLMTPEKQIYWIKQALETYPNPPNISNHTMKNGEILDIFKRSVEGDESAKNYLKKLAWCTLGYQYEWTTRKYHKDKFVQFPQDIGNFCELIACQCNYGPYKPEAAIVNFYSKDRLMGGHVDDAEYEMSKPIISLSIGSKSIFLLGGETRDVEPKAIFLESGDCMIMGGRARYCFHGIARILKDTIPSYLQTKFVDPQYKIYAEYMERDMMRININARQVFVDEDQKQQFDNAN